MPKSKPTSSRTAESKTAIVVACIALAGTLGAALIANWPHLIGKEQRGSHAIAVEIVGQNYRRAFALNFTTRFANKHEYAEVARSIAESHKAVQSKLVAFTDAGDPAAAATLRSMLEQLEKLDALFKEMQPFVGDFIRLDGTGPPRLTELFRQAEVVRTEYVTLLRLFASQTSVPLPSVPAEKW